MLGGGRCDRPRGLGPRRLGGPCDRRGLPQAPRLFQERLFAGPAPAFACAPHLARRLPAAKAAGSLSIGNRPIGRPWIGARRGAIIPFARRQPAKAPIGFACRPRREGRACALFFGAAGWPGRSARGPSASSAQDLGASPNPVGRCGRRLQPVAFFFSFCLICFLHSCFLCLRSPFCFFRIFSCAMRSSRKIKHGRPLSALPFSSSGFPLSDVPIPENKKAERSAGNAPLLANSIGSALRGHSARGLGVTANRACRCAIAFSRSFGPLPTAEFAGAGCFASPRWPWPRRS